jgi:NADH-quinone oxidoreductase subunit N
MNAIILSALWGVLMMYTGFATSNKKTVSIVAVIGVLAVLVANWLEYAGLSFFNIDTKGMIVYNSFGFVFNLVCHLTLLMYFLLSSNEIEGSSKSPSDHYALIFFITAGISIIAGFKSLLMLFIGIEIVSIPLYVLAGSDKSNLKSNEAALKYFLMGSFSTGILLMGIAFLYGDAGTFYLEGINMGGAFLTPMKAIGLVLLMVSMAFKVSAAPFHFWTPDVYDGTPTVYTSFMATLVKSAGFFAFLKLFETAFGRVHSEWEVLLSVIIVLTIVVGNITAVFQQSVKRMLSYSSIAQAGFMLLGVYAMNLMAKQGIILYFAAYGIASIGLFAVLAKFKDHSIEGLNGFAKKHPLVAGSMLVSLLSLAGIPLTAGFFAKYYMLLSAMKYGNSLWLVIVAILGAAVSIYYYFRVIQAMYFKEEQGQPSEEVTFSPFFKVMMVVNAIILLALGIHPDWLVMFL